jgi:pyrroloquinoline quinone biosynthesis protein B
VLMLAISATSTLAFAQTQPKVTLHILGTLQDGGAPHAGCKRDCCKKLFLHPDPNLKVVSLGVVDHSNDKTFLFEATPDFSQQIKMLKNLTSTNHSETPDGIFLTHAHIGHYTGLMYLGKEAMSAKEVPVYAMPRMKMFLAQNGPWSQLVNYQNISLQELHEGIETQVSSNVRITPLLVPHRDEYSETVGYIISGPNKKVLFIPDIDKWEKWSTDIRKLISTVDYAFIDGTFYDGDEISTRDISTIPHPFIIESMKLFSVLPKEERKKIYFIHFNHTNALINKTSAQYQAVILNGFNVAEMAWSVEL